MKDNALRSAVTRAVLTELAAGGEFWAPVATSSRHCHLSPADLERLFGRPLTPLRMLEQPGQFAAEEKVTLETPKGKLSLRVVGPIRKETQVELSLTDSAKLGLKPPVRMSGQLENSPGCVLKQGDRSIQISRGVIVAARHIHMSAEEAAAYRVRNGDLVSLQVEGVRAVTLENVIVRCGEGHVLEVHIDKDEANACGLEDGTLCRVIVPGEVPRAPVPGPAPAAPRPAYEPARPTMLDLTGEKARLITEEDVVRASGNGYKVIRYGKDAIVTPLARDAASEKRVELARAVE